MRKILFITILLFGTLLVSGNVLAITEDDLECCVIQRIDDFPMSTLNYWWNNMPYKIEVWRNDIFHPAQLAACAPMKDGKLIESGEACKTGPKSTNCDWFFGPLDALTTGLDTFTSCPDFNYIIWELPCNQTRSKKFPASVVLTEQHTSDNVEFSNICDSAYATAKKLAGIGECATRTETQCTGGACFWSSRINYCLDKYNHLDCSKITREVDCLKMAPTTCSWQDNTCLDFYQMTLRGSYGYQEGEGIIGGIMPACAFLGECRNLSDLMQVPLMAASQMFKYVGALAFVFFIVGGMMMILSFGNAERFAQGKKVLIAAVIGLIIVFAAYFIVNFISDLLGVSRDFSPLD